MKILLSAYACEPGQGSEEGVGWYTAIETAKHDETWVLTRSFYRAAIEAEINHCPIPNLHFIYVEPLGWNENFRGRQGGVQLHYYLWQILAYFVGKSLHSQVCFDIIRHVTYVKFWSPSFLALLPVPFIWGPVGGGEAAPKSFSKDFSLKAQIYEFARDWAQRLGESDPFARLTAQRSVIAQATTEDTAKRLIQMGASNVKIVPEAGLSKVEIAKLSSFPILETETMRFISMGRLLHWKGYHLAIRAFAQIDLPNVEYWLLGDGPERQRLEALAVELKVSGRIKFFGNVPRHQGLDRLCQAQVLVHPSLHDSGGWTSLEGMAAGRPVICLDLGGPAVQVTEKTGIKVAAISPEQVVQDLKNAMHLLGTNSELRIQMGIAARARVRETFDWEVKGKYFAQLYQEVVLTESETLDVVR